MCVNHILNMSYHIPVFLNKQHTTYYIITIMYILYWRLSTNVVSVYIDRCVGMYINLIITVPKYVTAIMLTYYNEIGGSLRLIKYIIDF